jgi:hypothetical protein
MKKILLSLSFFLLSLSCFSQSLEGEWNGTFNTNSGYSVNSQSIRLTFTLNKDSSYTVYCNGYNFKYDKLIPANYKRISQDSIYLKVTDQQMYLRVVEKKKTVNLIGIWQRKDPVVINEGLTLSPASGEISLLKKIKVSK